MVKRMTFLEIALVASLLVIGCVCGLAVAKEKLVLKYLPVKMFYRAMFHLNYFFKSE